MLCQRRDFIIEEEELVIMIVDTYICFIYRETMAMQARQEAQVVETEDENFGPMPLNKLEVL